MGRLSVYSPRDIAELRLGLEHKIIEASLEYEEALSLPVEYETGNAHTPTKSYLEKIDLPLLKMVMYADGRALLDQDANQQVAEMRWAAVCRQVLKRRGILLPNILKEDNEEQQIKAWNDMADRCDHLGGPHASRLWSAYPHYYAHLLNIGRIVLVPRNIAAFDELI